jgi:uncharacterized protein YndB with AHSA1/START domain
MNSEKATVATPSDLEITITRTFHASRVRVFQAWTSPEHLPQWLLGPDGWSMPVCEIDLRPGGTWRWLWRRRDGAEMEMTGSYREVVPPERFVSTESWGEEWPETLNTLVFSETGGKTTVVTTVRYPSQAARDAALASGMSDGLNLSYTRLDRYLAQAPKGERADPWENR